MSATLNEVLGYEVKGFSPGMSTYSAEEAGLDLSYELGMVVSAQVDKLSPKVEKKLVSHMKNTLGYGQCDIDKHNNTIYVHSITGINPGWILKYIRKNVDSNAR